MARSATLSALVNGLAIVACLLFPLVRTAGVLFFAQPNTTSLRDNRAF